MFGRRARMLIASAWSLSALFSLPYLYLYKEEMVGEAPSDRLECWIDLGPASNWQLYMILTATSLFLLPAIIIAACYIIIVITIWRKGQNLGLVEPHITSSVRHHHSMYDGTEVESKRASSRGLIPKAKIKTVKMTFVIVSVFVLCWCPYFIFNLLHVFHLLPENQTNVALSTFIQSLAPLNSAANPIIYCLFSGCDVCRALQRFGCVRWLLRRVFPCCECVQAGSSTSLSRVGTQYTYVSNRTTLKATGSRSTMTARRGTAEVQERHVTRRCLPGTPQRSTQL